MLDAWTLVHFLREHRALLVLSVVLGITAGTACMLWMPKLYTARAVLEVASSEQPFADTRQPTAANDPSSASLLKTVEQSVGGARRQAVSFSPQRPPTIACSRPALPPK